MVEVAVRVMGKDDDVVVVAVGEDDKVVVITGKGDDVTGAFIPP